MDYFSAASKRKAASLILLKLRPQFVGANRRNELIHLEADVLVAVAEGSSPAGARAWHFVVAVASSW